MSIFRVMGVGVAKESATQAARIHGENSWPTISAFGTPCQRNCRTNSLFPSRVTTWRSRLPCKISKLRGAGIEPDMRGTCTMTRDEVVRRSLDLLKEFMQVAFEKLGILDQIHLDAGSSRNDWAHPASCPKIDLISASI